MQYNTGMLIGRAFALASSTATPSDNRPDPVRELCQLAEGDRLALLLAQARYREFVASPPYSVEDERALQLLEAALERFDARCAA